MKKFKNQAKLHAPETAAATAGENPVFLQKPAKVHAPSENPVFLQKLPAPSENPFFLQKPAKTPAPSENPLFLQKLPTPSENPLFLCFSSRRWLLALAAAQALFSLPASAYNFTPSVYTTGLNIDYIMTRRVRKDVASGNCIMDNVKDSQQNARACADLQQVWGLNPYFVRPIEYHHPDWSPEWEPAGLYSAGFLVDYVFLNNPSMRIGSVTSAWWQYFYKTGKFGAWEVGWEDPFTWHEYGNNRLSGGYSDPYTFRENVVCSSANVSADKKSVSGFARALPATLDDYLAASDGKSLAVSTTCDGVYYDIADGKDGAEQIKWWGKNKGCRNKSGVVLNNFVREFDLEASYYEDGAIEDKFVEFLTNTTGKFVVLASGYDGPLGTDSSPYSFYLSESVPMLENEIFHSFGAHYLGALHSPSYNNNGQKSTVANAKVKVASSSYLVPVSFEDYVRTICNQNANKESKYKFFGSFADPIFEGGFLVDERLITGAAGRDDDDCMRLSEQLLLKNFALYQPLNEDGSGWGVHHRYDKSDASNYDGDDAYKEGGEHGYLNFLYSRAKYRRGGDAASLGKCYTFNMDYYDGIDTRAHAGPKWPLLYLRSKNFFYDNGQAGGHLKGVVQYVRNNSYMIDNASKLINAARDLSHNPSAFNNTFLTGARKDIDGAFLQTEFSIHRTSDLAAGLTPFTMQRSDGSQRAFKRGGLFSKRDKIDSDGGIFSYIDRSWLHDVERHPSTFRGFALHMRPTSTKKNFRLCLDGDFYCDRTPDDSDALPRVFSGAGDVYAPFVGGDMSAQVSSTNGYSSFDRQLMDDYLIHIWRQCGSNESDCVRAFTQIKLPGSLPEYYEKYKKARGKFLVAFYPDADRLEIKPFHKDEQKRPIRTATVRLASGEVINAGISEEGAARIYPKNRQRFLQPRYLYERAKCSDSTLASCLSNELERYVIRGELAFYRLAKTGDASYEQAQGSARQLIESGELSVLGLISDNAVASQPKLAFSYDGLTLPQAQFGPLLVAMKIEQIADAAGRPLYDWASENSGIIDAIDKGQVYYYIIDLPQKGDSVIGSVISPDKTRPTWQQIKSKQAKFFNYILTLVAGQNGYVALSPHFEGSVPASVKITLRNEALGDISDRLVIYNYKDQKLSHKSGAVDNLDPLNDKNPQTIKPYEFVVNTGASAAVGKNTICIQAPGNEETCQSFYVRPARMLLSLMQSRVDAALDKTIPLEHRCEDANGLNVSCSVPKGCTNDANTTCAAAFTAGWWELPADAFSASLDSYSRVQNVAAMRNGKPLGLANPAPASKANSEITITPVVAAPMRLRLIEGGFVNTACRKVSVDEQLAKTAQELNTPDENGLVSCSIPLAYTDGGVLKMRAKIEPFAQPAPLRKYANFSLASNNLDRFSLESSLSLMPFLADGSRSIAGLFEDDKLTLSSEVSYSAPAAARPSARALFRVQELRHENASENASVAASELDCFDDASTPPPFGQKPSCEALKDGSLDLSHFSLSYEVDKLNEPYEQLIKKLSEAKQINYASVQAAVVEQPDFWFMPARRLQVNAGISANRVAKRLKLADEALRASKAPVALSLQLSLAQPAMMANDQELGAFDYGSQASTKASDTFYTAVGKMPDIQSEGKNTFKIDPKLLELAAVLDGGSLQRVRMGACQATPWCYYDYQSGIFSTLVSSYPADIDKSASKDYVLVKLRESRQQQGKVIFNLMLSGDDFMYSKIEFSGLYRP